MPLKLNAPIVVRQLDWSFWGGWKCDWEPVEHIRGRPDSVTCFGFWTMRGLVKRINWWLEPIPKEPSDAN